MGAGVVEIQEWTTVGGLSGMTVTQPVRQYIDASEWSDGIFWMDVKYITGGVRLYIETSMTDEDEYFTPVVNYVSTTGTSMLISRFDSATTPIMRYLR
ncbi:MAG: hypothetical protein HUU55_23270 [Myxococcales bacterium]|nr:hypothetical protein [Myxococcales bacterium]